MTCRHGSLRFMYTSTNYVFVGFKQPEKKNVAESLKDDKLKKQDFFEQRVLEYLEENETQQELDF